MLRLWGLRLPPAGVLLLWPLLPLLLLLLPTAPAPHLAPYKPVIVVHGLFDSSYSFRHLLEYINQTHPGTVVTVLDLFDGRGSLRPLWEQMQGFRASPSPHHRWDSTDYLKWLFPTSMRSNLYRVC
ncbi:lysosomal thioesterase PPT2-like [Choloepus didactylus]|uniref:lysosomal thioesterase PPT2-like n=1 Tax=Choloepus didactylus TaxID=27675 RepID=UPI00189DA3C5|nr:lysosomal thioesterase PPT2-like [Choloepus didactylus]